MYSIDHSQKITTIYSPIKPEPNRIKETQIFHPTFFHIYCGRKGKILQFTAIAEKPRGMGTALGAIFKKTTKIQSDKQWMGKVGCPQGLLRNDPNTIRTRTKKEINLDTIREKLAYDLFQEFGRGLFLVPKSRLSLQPIFNDYTQSNMLAQFWIQDGIKESLQIMSSYLDGYSDLAKARTSDGNEELSFMQFLEKYHRPPDAILTSESRLVPIKGLMGILAVGRCLADVDVLGGGGRNAGFVWIRNGAKEIIAARAVKIDPGCAFRFTHEDTKYASENFVINTKEKLGSCCYHLQDLKDLQTSTGNYDSIVYWNCLTSCQQDEFVSVLLKSWHYLQSQEVLDLLFYREGKFSHPDDTYSTVAYMPKEISKIMCDEMKGWMEWQLEIYAEHVEHFKNNYPEKALQMHYLDPFVSIQNAIELQDFSFARDNLLFLFATDSEPKLCYEYLFKLLPHFETLDHLIKNLPYLIQRSNELTDLQYQLNIKLSHWYMSKNQYQEALLWSAKSLQISQSKTTHELASQLFFKIIEKHLQNFLNTGDLQITLKEYLYRIKFLMPFCVTEEDRCSLYALAKTKLMSNPHQFAFENQRIQDALETPFVKQRFMTTEKYHEIFKENSIHAFQTFLEDLFLILGTPPSQYAIRKAKPLNKKACEFVLLVKIDDPYFTLLIDMLKIQLLLVGKEAKVKLVTSESILDSYELKSILLKTNHPTLLQEYKKTPTKVPKINIEWKRNLSTSEMKQYYATPLLEFLIDLALFCNIDYTNTFDLIDALKIFTDDSRILLKESVALLDSDNHENFELLEKCHWLVMYPLTLCSFITPIQLTIDLVKISFENSFPNPATSLIRQIATHLWQTNAPLESHIRYFEALSKIPKESLRQIYIQCLAENSFIFLSLLRIPNQGGLRPLFFKNFKDLQASIYAITDSSITRVSIVVPKDSSPRYLKSALVDQMMDNENIKSMYKNSAHCVYSLDYEGHQIHLKQKPSQPLMEYAIHNLTSRIAGQITPASTLVRFNVQNKGKRKSYPVLISKTCAGKNLKEGWKNLKPNASYTWNLLCSILTRPGDGRLPNYILDPSQNIFCIDNDISFVEPVVKEILFRTVNFCSSLFCILPLSTPLDKNVLEEFLSLDSYAIFEGWIDDLIQKEKEYTTLFSEQEMKTLYEEDPNNSFTPTILFREGTLAALNLQFWELQQAICLSLQKKLPFTAADLLQKLLSIREESIGPYIYKSYNVTRGTPEEKLKKATSRAQEHSMTSVQYHQACLGKIPSYEEISKSNLYSPENARKEFFSTFLEKNTLFATVKTSQQGTTILANFLELKDDPSRERLVLKALAEQFKRMDTKPLSISFHHSNTLNQKLLEPFLHEKLEFLDLRYCTSLKSINFIQKACPKLKSLKLAGCAALTKIKGSIEHPLLKFTELEDLDISLCDNLDCLQLEALKLMTLNTKHNSQVINIELVSCFASIDSTDSPQVSINHTQLDFGINSWMTFGENELKKHYKNAENHPFPNDRRQILNSPQLAILSGLRESLSLDDFEKFQNNWQQCIEKLILIEEKLFSTESTNHIEFLHTPEGIRAVKGLLPPSFLKIIGLTEENYSHIYGLGNYFYKSNDFQKASEVFHLCALIDYLRHNAWVAYGLSEKNNQNYKEALEAFKMAILTNPEDPVPMIEGAECALKLGHGQKQKDDAKLCLKFINDAIQHQPKEKREKLRNQVNMIQKKI